MMNEHELQLATKPFQTIALGKKTIESRLFDEKRQIIALDDVIIFTNREDPSQQCRVKVIGLLRYKSFADMFTHNDPIKFGNKSVEWLLKQINEFYPESQQRIYGVIGIEFALV